MRRGRCGELPTPDLDKAILSAGLKEAGCLGLDLPSQGRTNSWAQGTGMHNRQGQETHPATRPTIGSLHSACWGPFGSMVGCSRRNDPSCNCPTVCSSARETRGTFGSSTSGCLRVEQLKAQPWDCQPFRASVPSSVE